MKKELDTKFWVLNQNNSGGYYINNEIVKEYVIIEARNVENCQQKAGNIFEDYRECCSCCGERWDDDLLIEDESTKTPNIYAKEINLEAELSPDDGNVVIYFIDGTQKYYRYK
jgi:hypothetical protein